MQKGATVAISDRVVTESLPGKEIFEQDLKEVRELTSRIQGIGLPGRGNRAKS